VKLPFLLAILSLFAAACQLANANISINPTFESSITSNPMAQTIETGIDQAISNIESYISNPVTVSIDFGSMNNGLGRSTTLIQDLPYSLYLSALANRQILSSNDKIALASLPRTPNNPVNGNPDVFLTLPNLRAIGEPLGNNPGNFDSAINLNLSDMNLSRTGPQDAQKYDLQTVTTHEIDEALGIGGSGSVLSNSGPTVPTGPVGSMDLFRYAGTGVRSFTTSVTATAYFSINGGATDLTNFNQNGIGGADFGDWASGPTPQVQDAFGSPGADPNLGSNELTALDVIGYNLVSVPEPESGALLFGGLIAIGTLRGRQVSNSRAHERKAKVPAFPLRARK
jgi:hypothetical protein